MKKIIINMINKKYNLKNEAINRLNNKDIGIIDLLKICHYLKRR